MPFKKEDGVAMYKGADWAGYKKTVPNCTPEQARRIAIADPEISFFFICSGSMVLENPSWPQDRVFSAGDAVFFSGDPWWGSASQCDGYVKDGMSIAYIDPSIPANVEAATKYETSQGLNAVDVVCLFAANLNVTVPQDMTRLAPDITVPTGGTLAVVNNPYLPSLQTQVKKLQDAGITVLLTFLGNHDAAGWSNFDGTAAGVSDANLFADQILAIVQKYSLDGIDIDDEYSNPLCTNTASLAMVTSFIKDRFKGAGIDGIISKALFDDTEQFATNYGGKTLAESLSLGACMAYGAPLNLEDPKANIFQPYLEAGMKQSDLSMGYWTEALATNPAGQAAELRANGYAGVMVYAFEQKVNQQLLGELVNAWGGPGSWQPTALQETLETA